MRPVGFDAFTRAVASAMMSPWAMGPSRFRHATTESDAEAVYLGALTRDDFLALGGIRTFPTGVAEDADFYFRLGKAGARVVLDPLIVSSYRPRTGWRSLFRQFRRYGQGKAEMFWANGEFPTWRPLAPLALVILLAAAAIVSIVVGSAAPVLWVGGGWLLGLLLVSLQHGLLAPLVAAVAAVMQVSYGLGLAWGLLRGPGPVNGLRLPVGRVVPAGGAAADEGDRHPEGR
jgi:hypothetical protein